jgi:photosynthetic reaction center cytochrome c subunit
MGDAPKAQCVTCHNGAYKPLYGAQMAKDFPALWGRADWNGAPFPGLGGASRQGAADSTAMAAPAAPAPAPAAAAPQRSSARPVPGGSAVGGGVI